MAIICPTLTIFHATAWYRDHNSNFKVGWSWSMDKITFSFFLCTWQYKTQSTFVKGAGSADLELLALLLAPLGTDPRLLDLWYNFRTLLPFTTGEFCEESLVNTENLSWGENFTFLYVKSTLIYVLYRDQMTSQSTARHDSPWNICPFRMCLVLGSQKGRVEEWRVD